MGTWQETARRRPAASTARRYRPSRPLERSILPRSHASNCACAQSAAGVSRTGQLNNLNLSDEQGFHRRSCHRCVCVRRRQVRHADGTHDADRAGGHDADSCVHAVGTGHRCLATAALTNATTQDVTAQATWSSSNPDVATVNAAGLVRPGVSGETDTTAT
jgi:hypothetical protein